MDSRKMAERGRRRDRVETLAVSDPFSSRIGNPGKMFLTSLESALLRFSIVDFLSESSRRKRKEKRILIVDGAVSFLTLKTLFIPLFKKRGSDILF